MAGDSCLYGETYALRTVRQRYPDSQRAQQAVRYYLGAPPALTGPQILQRVFNVNVTALQAYQNDPEVCSRGAHRLLIHFVLVRTQLLRPERRGNPAALTTTLGCGPIRGALRLMASAICTAVAM